MCNFFRLANIYLRINIIQKQGVELLLIFINFVTGSTFQKVFDHRASAFVLEFCSKSQKGD